MSHKYYIHLLYGIRLRIVCFLFLLFRTLLHPEATLKLQMEGRRVLSCGLLRKLCEWLLVEGRGFLLGEGKTYPPPINSTPYIICTANFITTHPERNSCYVFCLYNGRW